MFVPHLSLTNMITPAWSLIIFLIFSIAEKCNCDDVFKSSFDEEKSTEKSNNDGTTETHYTTCKITTEQFVADAQATFTRVLTGTACNAQIMNERFEKFQQSVNERLDEIKKLIVDSMAKNFSYKKNSTVHDEKYSVSNFVVKNEAQSPNGNDKISYLSRQDEIKNFNNTVHDVNLSPTDDDRRQNVYTYYWRVSNLHEKILQWQTGRFERSSTFYVIDAGYAMYLKFTPKYFPDGTIFISVGLTSGRNDSKITWPFPLPIRVEILDVAQRRNDRAKEDRSSRLWDPATVCSSYFWGRPGRIFFANGESSDNPECVGLSVPRRLLTGMVTEQIPLSSSLTGKYVSNDSLLVKLTVYL